MFHPARVLHIVKNLGLGGTEKTMQLFVSHLDRERFTPVVYSFEDGPRRRALQDAGVEVFVGGDLLDLTSRLGPDIAHIHRAGWPEPRFLRTLALAGIPHVVETNVFGRFDPSPQASIIDRHLFVSHFCLWRYRAVNGIPASPRYQVLYNPVDTDFYVDNPVPRDWTGHAAGRVSRPDPGKWSPLGYRFLPRLLRRVPDATYRIIGATPEVRDWFAARGLDQHVQYCDPAVTEADLAAFYGSCSVLAHANATGESFGLSIAEAMAAGLPVVTHPAEGMRDNAQLELVDDGVTGYVVNTEDDYAAAIARLLTDPDLARTMGAGGREKAVRHFRVQHVTRALETLYQDLLDRRTTDANAPYSASSASI
ncbi:glycosyltransferase family 4 protein [Desulfobaculum sp.]|jgi:glycosyltransferase involved in cell wall biosynthesis